MVKQTIRGKGENMKRGMKFFAWMMVVVLLCGSVMAGCGSGKDAPAAQPEEKASEEEPAEQEQTQNDSPKMGM